mmetsp:Transcript_6009/g.15266  ORF Transcript_6009/g.15266 Transcript_6009/m.15266 type:complete len:200 (+) Transcript_6009:628-1227(+)
MLSTRPRARGTSPRSQCARSASSYASIVIAPAGGATRFSVHSGSRETSRSSASSSVPPRGSASSLIMEKRRATAPQSPSAAAAFMPQSSAPLEGSPRACSRARSARTSAWRSSARPTRMSAAYADALTTVSPPSSARKSSSRPSSNPSSKSFPDTSVASTRRSGEEVVHSRLTHRVARSISPSPCERRRARRRRPSSFP